VPWDHPSAVAANVFKALGHPLRVRLVKMLTEERCVCELVPELGQTQPTVSKHLAILHREGLVLRRKDGLRVLYQLAPGTAELVAQAEAFVATRRRRDEALWTERVT